MLCDVAAPRGIAKEWAFAGPPEARPPATDLVIAPAEDQSLYPTEPAQRLYRVRSVGQNGVDELPAIRSISQRMDRDLDRHARRQGFRTPALPARPLERPSGSPTLGPARLAWPPST